MFNTQRNEGKIIKTKNGVQSVSPDGSELSTSHHQIRLHKDCQIHILQDGCLKNGQLTSKAVVIYIYRDHGGMWKMGMWGQNTESYVGLTPYEGFIERYRPQTSGFKWIEARAFIIFDREQIPQSSLAVDDYFRREVKTLFQKNKIGFSANWNKHHATDDYPNKEELIDFDFDDHWLDLQHIFNSSFNKEKNFSGLPPFEARPYQEGDSERGLQILNDNSKLLLAGHTGYGKTLVGSNIASLYCDQHDGNLIIVTSPATNTLDDFENQFRTIKFGSHSRNPIIVHRNQLDSINLNTVKKWIRQGERIVVLMSPQGARSNADEGTWNAQGIKKYKKWFDLANVWIRDEKWMEYDGPITRKLMKQIEGNMAIIDMAATISKIKHEYQECQIIDKGLLWGFENRHLTNLPDIRISSINPQAMDLVDKIRDIVCEQDNWHPGKLIVPNDTRDGIANINTIIELYQMMYEDSFLAKKWDMSVTDDQWLCEYSKQAGIWIWPEGEGDWGAGTYLPILVDQLNHINSRYHHMTFGEIISNAKREKQTANEYFETLIQTYPKILIHTHRKGLIGTSIDRLGHAVILDKISSGDLFEQGPIGRLIRKIQGKINIKIWSLAPGQEIKEVKLDMVRGNVINPQENIDKVIAHYDNIPLSYYDVDKKIIVKDQAEDMLEAVARLEYNKSSDTISNTDLDDYLDTDSLDIWKKIGIRISSKGSSLKVNSDNGGKTKETDKKKPGPKQKTISEQTVRVLIKETVKTLVHVSCINDFLPVKKLLKDKMISSLIDGQITKQIDSSLCLMIQNKIDELQSHLTLIPNSAYEIAKRLKQTEFWTRKSIQFMPMEMSYDEFDHIDHDFFVVINPLNGSMMNALKQRFPKARIVGIDQTGWFISNLTKQGFECYNSIDKIEDMKKQPYVVINPPWTNGEQSANNLYAGHIKNVFDKLNPVGILSYTPEGLLTQKKDPNKSLRNSLVEKYGAPKYLKWLDQSKDWLNTIKKDSICVVFEQGHDSKTTKVIGRETRTPYEVELDFNNIFPCDSQASYEYIKSIQTTDKIEFSNSKKDNIKTSKKGPVIRLHTNNKTSTVDGNVWTSHNDCWRTAIAYMRQKCVGSVPPGVSIQHGNPAYNYITHSSQEEHEKFKRYMLSQHTRWLVKLRYTSRSADNTAFELIPKIDLSQLPKDFTDEDLFVLFNTPKDVIEEIKQIGNHNPY